MLEYWFILEKMLEQNFTLNVFVTLLLTTVLCTVIGLEREHIHRPAGVRTHMLVGLSASLVMMTSEYMMLQSPGAANIDPTRLGAQVISGIGFLGAGTIIKEGYNVKGLTTAASLWSVACIGLATGCGFYSGAILLTVIILITLRFIRKLLPKHSQSHILIIFLKNIDETINVIRNKLEEDGLYVHEVEIVSPAKRYQPSIKITLSQPPELHNLEYITSQLEQIDGVLDVYLK